MKTRDLISRLAEKNVASAEDLYQILSDKNEENDYYLRQMAHLARLENASSSVFARGLIEFSNTCKNNCLYCGLRRDNTTLDRFRLEPDEIIALALKSNFKTVVLQSAEDSYYTPQMIEKICSELKKAGISTTLSMGEKTFDEYQSYKQAGADGYLLRIETTDSDLYHRLDPEMSWVNRVNCLTNLKKIGYEVESGIMVGLPNQTIDSLVKDLLFLQRQAPAMCGVGPFIPHRDTPLAVAKGNEFDLSIKVMALMRLLMPAIKIPATTSMGALRPNGVMIALTSGANMIMQTITPQNVRELYSLFNGKGSEDKEGNNANKKLINTLRSSNMPITKHEPRGINYHPHRNNFLQIH